MSARETLHDVLLAARRELTAAGLAASSADADVDVLARHVLGWDRATLLVRRREPAPDGFNSALATLVVRRAAREPVAYITGRREFWGLEFEVTPDVLIPRPETELVVEEALAAIKEGSGVFSHEFEKGLPTPPIVLDVGTGSGCLAIAVARSTDARVVATDVSRRALAVARRNALRLSVDSRVRLVAGDLLAPFRRSSWADVLVANPPYVTQHAAGVMPDVRRYEPATALYSGPDGLNHIRRLVARGPDVVRPGGWLIFEFGDGQDDDVRSLVDSSDWSIAAVRSDLQGIPRVIVARRRM